ncbi:hypothetical protein ANCDUO_08526 [Ancylostoma duodenale]|uniref:Uncharacterized protein n=1 Tax=Ancylostoma duodenale TaxID=51022 RepID=A0A0C2CW98_9BILA|nr:hypothetical protein ANCDUO_08526 [Ancylostoma duodenale]
MEFIRTKEIHSLPKAEPRRILVHFWHSFIPHRGCAAYLRIKRFPSAAEKLKFVPGLEAKLRHAQLDKELGIPPLESWRRGSLASYLPLPSFGNFSLRGSRRSSQVSFNSPNIFVQV